MNNDDLIESALQLPELCFYVQNRTCEPGHMKIGKCENLNIWEYEGPIIWRSRVQTLRIEKTRDENRSTKHWLNSNFDDLVVICQKLEKCDLASTSAQVTGMEVSMKS